MNHGQRIFLAGASGAIGRRLIPLLLAAGYHVTGTTRSLGKAEQLRALGAEPIVVDVFNADELLHAVVSARPRVVIHQLTDLPPGLAPDRMAAALPRNARLRDEGTRHLVAAAIAAGAERIVAQSIAWMYRPGPEPHREGDPLDTEAAGTRRVSVDAVVALERQTLETPAIEGVVLRYGQLYGPGTGTEVAAGALPLHVDAAAYAALLAVDRGTPGIYNVAEPNAYMITNRARLELGWAPAFRLGA